MVFRKQGEKYSTSLLLVYEPIHPTRKVKLENPQQTIAILEFGVVKQHPMLVYPIKVNEFRFNLN